MRRVKRREELQGMLVSARTIADQFHRSITVTSRDSLARGSLTSSISPSPPASIPYCLALFVSHTLAIFGSLTVNPSEELESRFQSSDRARSGSVEIKPISYSGISIRTYTNYARVTLVTPELRWLHQSYSRVTPVTPELRRLSQLRRSYASYTRVTPELRRAQSSRSERRTRLRYGTLSGLQSFGSLTTCYHDWSQLLGDFINSDFKTVRFQGLKPPHTPRIGCTCLPTEPSKAQFSSTRSSCIIPIENLFPKPLIIKLSFFMAACLHRMTNLYLKSWNKTPAEFAGFAVHFNPAVCLERMVAQGVVKCEIAKGSRRCLHVEIRLPDFDRGALELTYQVYREETVSSLSRRGSSRRSTTHRKSNAFLDVPPPVALETEEDEDSLRVRSFSFNTKGSDTQVVPV
ncbi:unnamed protein product, partial [Nesidiocoris tenuis]